MTSTFPAARIPVLDLRVTSANTLVDALRRDSCVFLTGLDEFSAGGSFGADLAAMVEASREFFALDPAEKARVRWSGTGEWAGWQPLYEGGPDALLLERYELALPDPAGFADDGAWAATFDLWPEHPPRMTAAWAAYYRSARTLTNRLVEMIAGALGLPEADLPAWTTRQHSNLCVNHYLPQREEPAPGQTRQRPHADIGGLTLLWADGRAGLEAALGPDGAWVPVEFPPGAVLLQAGDLLHLWTRGSIPKNLHRVVNPPRTPGIPPTARYSAVFFHHPDLETWVAPTGTVTTETDSAGVTARDHVLARQRAAYRL
ncbi:isopenicillin N synthase family oxygenase [Frankia sp. CNm7]|uniref:Isopenicillin N synthase family oxygenase n=1 Tax=Frankia nepalensis TaxID=1836974 RepID=A0A937UU16_9ACTN|nr:2OG-Fe(II) oxygenase family protein [Frankia nepalensis]MBL7502251.1 isopenicillin N synthase family oxygenase [Frankia nepalensis]MBL7516040.1 isopenicillin N synthase family oxygenase [Frankia nepalensis]MBL7521372.1 isopenicillin N synthase family oxygenase [Frankia nepalensis]MBL7631815.1 isopenicillin N synthase family oxygenase [Frankia nepalensis]